MVDHGCKQRIWKRDDKAALATLLGCQGVDEFRAMLPAAMNFGVTPVEIKEIAYQAVAYLGISRVFPFLKAIFFLALPLMANTVMIVNVLSKLCRKISQHLGDPDLLRADLLTIAAL